MMPQLIITLYLIVPLQVVGTAPSSYATQVKNIATKRAAFRQAYQAASPAKRPAVLKAARQYLLQAISTGLMPHWYGTPWDFNGTTKVPRQGAIACGYFVTAILSDAGFHIPRVTWAQSASEVFIKKLAPHSIKRFSNAPMAQVEHYLQQRGQGLYLVGLDQHVGFIVMGPHSGSFVHANYYQPAKGVMSEPLKGHNPLNDSSYRVIGRLLSDDMLRNWLYEHPYK